MDFFNRQYEDLKSIVEEKSTVICKLETDNALLQSTVTDLSNRLCAVEQHMRGSNLEINGIPEHRTENLVNTVIQLSRSIDNPVSEDDILHTTRVAKLMKQNDKPRTVIVKMRSPRLRDSILAAVVRFNKKNATDKLNSHHLGLAGTITPVFVAEHLTPNNEALHAATRKKCKDVNFKFVWVRNGRIYVRKDESCSAITIRNMDSLKLLT
ncbi:uncharacterized protein LOC115449995 [Manduca sexta]|nr:uncharacterized protein LOC115449995 [Manduca sexta]